MTSTLTASEYQQLGNASMGKVRKKRGHPEQDMCIAFADQLRALQSLHQCPRLIFWTHIDNGARSGSNRQRIMAGGIAKQMGVLPGIADYCFWYEATWLGAVKHPGASTVNCTAFIEFKSATGKLSDEQKTFQHTCLSKGIPYIVVRSPEEALRILSEWGVIQ